VVVHLLPRRVATRGQAGVEFTLFTFPFLLAFEFLRAGLWGSFGRGLFFLFVTYSVAIKHTAATLYDQSYEQRKIYYAGPRLWYKRAYRPTMIYKERLSFIACEEFGGVAVLSLICRHKKTDPYIPPRATYLTIIRAYSSDSFVDEVYFKFTTNNAQS